MNTINQDEYKKLVYKCNTNKSKYTYKYFYNYKDTGFIKKFRIYLDSNKKLFYFDENNGRNYLIKLVVFYE